MTPRHKRVLWVTVIVAGIGIAAALILTAFQKNLLYFYSPTQVAHGEAPVGRAFRIGGLVMKGSVTRVPNSLKVSFVLSDTVNKITVIYDGILPDLFREGKIGSDGVFVASEVLAKHDENYMPPEVADALKKAGVHYDRIQ